MTRRPARAVLPVAAVAAGVVVLAMGEASLVYIETLLGESRNEYGWLLRRFLVPWAVLAVFVPVVLALAARFDLAGRRARLAWLVHGAGSAVIGVSHLFALVLVWKAIGDEPAPALALTASLVSRYLLQDVFLYWAGVAGLQAVWRQQALRARELAEARLSDELARARLAVLTAQLEPHFLFNALNTAVMLVRDGSPQRAVDVLVRLGDLLRSILAHGPDAPAPLVPLETEWEFLRGYLAIEEARFEDRLIVRLAPLHACGQATVPFLIVQPLVENALRHGIAHRAGAGPGVLTVSAARDGGSLRIEVRDNGRGPATGRVDGAAPGERVSGHGRGLANVRARLHAHYRERASVALDDVPSGGAIATLTLPWTAASSPLEPGARPMASAGTL